MRLLVVLPDSFGYPIAAGDLADYVEEMFPDLSAEWFWDDSPEANYGLTEYGVRIEGNPSDEEWHTLLMTLACHCLKQYGAFKMEVPK